MNPKCEVCGGGLLKWLLDRSGWTYWCHTCAKADAKRLIAEHKAIAQEEK